MTDKNFEPLRLAFKKYNWVGWEENDLLIKNINHSVKGDMHLYNYGKMVLVARNHPVVVKCRGLVVRVDGTVVHFPFERFFNDFEQEKTELDWQSAKVEEKVDGSYIGVFWNGNDWEITTRNSFYPSERDDAKFDVWFKKLFKNFDELDKNICYVFELISRNNPVVTFYDKEFVVLLGARYLDSNIYPTHEEIDDVGLDYMAEELGVSRPRQFSLAKDIVECKALFSKLREDEEGFVVKDKNYNRVKLKQESYLKLAKIKMLNTEALFNHVIEKEVVDLEFLEKLPEVKEEIKRIALIWVKAKIEIWDEFEKLKPFVLESRKSFALHVLKSKWKNIHFGLVDGKKLEDIISYKNIETLF